MEEIESELCEKLDEISDAEEEACGRERLVDAEIDKLNDMIATLDDTDKRLNRAKIVQELCDCVEALREALR